LYFDIIFDLTILDLFHFLHSDRVYFIFAD
jgi:hypothetical protein